MRCKQVRLFSSTPSSANCTNCSCFRMRVFQRIILGVLNTESRTCFCIDASDPQLGLTVTRTQTIPDSTEKDVTSGNQTHAPKQRTGRMPCASSLRQRGTPVGNHLLTAWRSFVFAGLHLMQFSSNVDSPNSRVCVQTFQENGLSIPTYRTCLDKGLTAGKLYLHQQSVKGTVYLRDSRDEFWKSESQVYIAANAFLHLKVKVSSRCNHQWAVGNRASISYMCAISFSCTFFCNIILWFKIFVLHQYFSLFVQSVDFTFKN